MLPCIVTIAGYQMSDAGTGPGGPQALGPDTTAVTAVTASGKRISTTSLIAIIVIVCLVILIVIATAVAVTLSRVKENAKPANIPLSERLSGKHLRIVPQNRVSCSKLPPGIKRTVVSNSPIVDLLSGVLTQEQCEHLIALANPRFKRSVVVEPTTGAFVENKDRTSSTVFLDRDETPVVKDIQARVSQAAGMPVAYLERLQVVRYKPGQFYKPHFDYLEASTQDVVDHGQRVITVFAYLNDLDLKYCSRVKRRTRRGLLSNSPSEIHTRASCASKSSAWANCTGCVATTGKCMRAASCTAASTWVSSCGRPTRCSSR